MSTSESLSNLFNFDSSAIAGKYYSRPILRPVLSDNRYFKQLIASGYSIKVLESSHLNYCKTPAVAVVACNR